jgi:hypothetical protein
VPTFRTVTLLGESVLQDEVSDAFSGQPPRGLQGTLWDEAELISSLPAIALPYGVTVMVAALPFQ